MCTESGLTDIAGMLNQDKSMQQCLLSYEDSVVYSNVVFFFFFSITLSTIPTNNESYFLGYPTISAKNLHAEMKVCVVGIS